MSDQWQSHQLHEHPAPHRTGTWGKVCLSIAGVYYLRVGGSNMSCPQDWAARIQAEEQQQEPDQQYALRVDPEIYRKAKAKATLEGITMRDLFTMLLQNYISQPH